MYTINAKDSVITVVIDLKDGASLPPSTNGKQRHLLNIQGTAVVDGRAWTVSGNVMTKQD